MTKQRLHGRRVAGCQRAWGAVAVIGVVGSGCAGAARPVAHVRAAPPARATPSVPAGTELGWTPTWRDLEYAADLEEDHGTRRILVGTVRVEMRAGRFDVATDVLAQRIIQAAHVAHGWIFVDQGGLVASSDTFLGPLRRLGQLRLSARDRDRGPRDSGRGRFAFAGRDGAIVSSDGTGALVAARQPPPVPARWVVFVDPDHGFAASNDGQLFASRDGGVTFAPVETPDAVMDYRWSSDGLVLRTVADERLVGADGAIGPMPAAPRDERRSHGLSPREHDALNEAIDAAFPGRLAQSAAVLNDGTAVRARDRDLVTYELATGATRSRAVGVLPGECAPVSWGVSFALQCGRATLRTRDGRTFEALPLEGYVLSDDGRHAAHSGPCTPDAAERPAHQQLCVLTDGERSTRAIEVPVDARLLPTASGPHFLLDVGRYANGGENHGLMLVDADAATVSPVALGPSARGFRIDEAALLHDGTVFATLRRTAEDDSVERKIALGHAGAPLDLRALPAGATDASFIDAAHGVAAGRDFQHVWQTDDGGRTWRLLALPVDGVLAAPEYGGLDVNCNAALCSVGDRVVVRGWGPLRAARARVMAPPAGPPPSGDGDGDGGRHFVSSEAAPLTCVAARRVTQPGLALARARGAHGRPEPAELRAGAIVRYTPHATDTGLDLAWAGLDGDGLYEGRAALPAESDGATYSRVLAVTRRGVFMYRGSSRANRTVYFARAGGTFAARPDAAPFVRVAAPNGASWATLTARDGGLVVLAAGTYSSTPFYDLARFDGDGMLTAHHSLVGLDTDGQLYGVARRNGIEGAVLTDRDDPWQLRWLAASPDATPEPFVRRTGEPLAMCQGPTPRDAVVIVSAAFALPRVRLDRDHPVRDTEATGELEATDGRLCVRRLRVGIEFEDRARHTDQEVGLLELAADTHGRVAGSLISATGRRAVRCPPPAARDRDE